MRNKGFAAFLTSVVLLSAMILLVVFTSFLVLRAEKMSHRSRASARAYYIAESGAEDALLRLSKGLPWESSYSFSCGGGSASVTILDKVGGARTIKAVGDVSGEKRKVEVVYGISSEKISFHYGAQVGEGGLSMANNSRVKGNVYSNGNITAAKGGVGYIEETAVVAQNGNLMDGIEVWENALTYSCKDSKVLGDLTYVEGGVVDNCTVEGAINSQTEEIPAEELPVSSSQVEEWKQGVRDAGNVITGDYEVPAKETRNLGPVEIDGSLTFGNDGKLKLTGTVLVTGDLEVANNSSIELDAGSYGSLSGVLIVEGKIKVQPGTYLGGTGEEGSYLMLVSTDPETVDTSSPAILVDNTAEAAIFYTTQGLIVLRNNVSCREVTGYKIFLDNLAAIEYESGLAEASFVSGPGGGWNVTSWKEVE